jgi:hypothetical protein
VKIKLRNNFYLPSAAPLWLFLPWQPLLFKSLDKIVFVTKFGNGAKPRLALNLGSLTANFASLCKRSVRWHYSSWDVRVEVYLCVCMQANWQPGVMHRAMVASIASNLDFKGSDILDCTTLNANEVH